MFTRRAKPIRIIGDPDNQRPDEWSSAVRLSTACGLPARGTEVRFFRLPFGLSRRFFLNQNAYQSRTEMQMASTKLNYFYYGRTDFGVLFKILENIRHKD